MAQMGFFDLSDRYASLDANKEPRFEIDAVVPWDKFRLALERVWRKPMDAVLTFKMVVLSAPFNLSDDRIEYQVRDRLSLMRFLRLGPEGRVSDAKTVWFYLEPLTQAGLVETLFKQFDSHLARQCYIARGSQVLYASILAVPRDRNTRDENKTVKSGDVPEDWKDKPAKRSQKDVDARCSEEEQNAVRGIVLPASKHGKSNKGYKNDVNVDRKHKLVRRYHVSDAAQHDSQAVDHMLMRGNNGSGVWADSAYRSEEMDGTLRDRKLKSHIHRKGKRGKPLTEQAKGSNRIKSSVRVRVEHVFGAQVGGMSDTPVRRIGMVRARAKIRMKNLAYNMRSLVQLRRMNPCAA